jgi:hypothetical protein
MGWPVIVTDRLQVNSKFTLRPVIPTRNATLSTAALELTQVASVEVPQIGLGYSRGRRLKTIISRSGVNFLPRDKSLKIMTIG